MQGSPADAQSPMFDCQMTQAPGAHRTQAVWQALRLAGSCCAAGSPGSRRSASLRSSVIARARRAAGCGPRGGQGLIIRAVHGWLVGLRRWR